MKKNNSTYIDNLVNKIISETLEERADSLVSRLNKSEDRGHGKNDLSTMSDEELEDLLNKPVRGGMGNDEDEIDEGFDDEGIKSHRKGRDFSTREFRPIPKNSKYNMDNLRDDSITPKKYLDNKLGDFKDMLSKFNDEDDDFEDSDDDGSELVSEDSEVCECGGGLYEGECMECGKSYMDEDIYDVDDLDSDNEFDYAQEEEDFDSDDSETNDENKEFCKYQKQKIESGDLTPEEKEDFIIRFEEKCSISENKRSMNERLKGNQKRIDKNKNNKIDAEDFTMLRKKSKKAKTSLKLSESEMIDLIEKIVLEDKEKVKSNIKNLSEPKGLSTYRSAVKGSGKENDDYIKSVAKKMKDYLKDGSKGDYDPNPKHFPKNNGQIDKMKKMAYEVSKDGEEFLDDYMRPGMENLDYDEMHPNEDWMKDNIEGSSRTGNNPEWANAEETELGVKLNKKRKENKFAKARRMAANKSPQPVVSDKPGQESGKGLNIKVESTEPKTNKKLNEEFEKMKSLISYDRKTQ
jgi:hypothetical protein